MTSVLAGGATTGCAARMNHSRRILLLAAILGVVFVSAGAFGAHGLRDTLERLEHEVGKPGGVELWQTAVNYALLHAAALTGLAGFVAQNSWRPLRIAAGCWFYGALIFSGTLMAMALGAPKWLGAVTPFGGLAFIAGWALVGFAAARRPHGARPQQGREGDSFRPGAPRLDGRNENRKGDRRYDDRRRRR